MIRSSRKIQPVYLFIDLLFLGLVFYISYFYRYNIGNNVFSRNISLPNFQEYSLIFMIWATLLVIAFKGNNLYVTDRGLNIPREIGKVAMCIFYTSVFMAGVIFFVQYKFFSRQIFLSSVFLLCVFLSGWRTIKRLILRQLISRGFHNINVLIIGAGKVGRAIVGEIRRYPYWGFNIVGFLDDDKNGLIDGVRVLGGLSKFTIAATKYFIDEVIVSIPSERSVVFDLIKQAKKMRLGLRIIPESFEESMPALEIGYLGVVPLITYKNMTHHPAEFALKRLFDFSLSLILIILLLPLFLAIAVLIKLDSPGPVFYVRKRSGYKGKVFNFYKFRSMVREADELKSDLIDKNESRGSVIFKIKKDPRITRVGKILRRYSLDELPQIINVLMGDMSLVGPRPFPVEESQKFEYNHMERLSIRPGITGLAQTRGRSDLSFYRWVKWDLWYMNNWSFWLDLMILLRTIPTILRGKGAY